MSHELFYSQLPGFISTSVALVKTFIYFIIYLFILFDSTWFACDVRATNTSNNTVYV